MALTKKQREQLKPMFGGRCAYCGEVLGEKWHGDHVEAVYRRTKRVWVPAPDTFWGGKYVTKPDGMDKPHKDVIENYFPACVPCNLFKSTFSLEGFRRQISCQVERARDYSVNFRMAERFGLIMVHENPPIVFWFEAYRAEEQRREQLNLPPIGSGNDDKTSNL